MVEESDMEQLAHSSLLGRAWRSWRKSSRKGVPLTLDNLSIKTPSHRDSMTLASSPGQSSFGTAHENDDEHTPTASHADEAIRDGMESSSEDVIPDASYPEHVLAANIALPIGDEERDIEEIDVPGLARDPSETDSDGFRTPKEHFITHRRSSSDFRQSQSVPYHTFRHRSRSLPTLRESLSEIKESIDVVAGAAQKLAGLVKMDTMEDSHNKAPRKHALVAEEVLSEGVVSDDLRSAEKTDNVTSHEPQQELEESNEGQSLVAGAVAGASVLAAAAVSLVFGSSEGKANSKPVVQAEDEPLVNNSQATSPVSPLSNGRQPPMKTEAITNDRLISKDVELNGTAGHVPEAEHSEAVDAHADGRNVESAAVPRQSMDQTKPRATQEDQAPSVNSLTAIQTETDLEDTEHDPDMLITRRNIEEFENQKYRLSVKGNKRTEEIKATEPRTNSPDPVVLPDSPARPESTASQQSFSLFPKTTAPGNDRTSIHSVQSHVRGRSSITTEVLHGDVRDARPQSVGVAQTADSLVNPSRSGEQTPEDQMLTKHTSTANPRRYSRLILSMDEGSPPSSATNALENELEVDDPSNRRVSPVSWEAEKPAVPSETQQRAVNRQSAPANGLQQQAQTPEKSTWRQSLGASLDRNGQRPSGKRSTEMLPDMPVHDHPVIQKLADKKNISKANKDEVVNPLTSASIRGPEDFDMFVQGGDMVKYTLTPENVRGDGVSPERERVPSQKASSDSVTNAGTAQPQAEDGRISRSQSIKRATAAAPDTSEDAQQTDTFTSKADKRRSIGRPPTRNSSIHRKSGLFAREPQVQTDSTNDFADFIRSTGPDKDGKKSEEQPKDSQIYSLPNTKRRSTISLHSIRNSFRSRSKSLSRPSSPGAASTRSERRVPLPDGDVPPVPALPGNRKSLAPRDEKSSKGGASDLIDFIRNGPRNSNQNRISRSIAPFRTTMDSDQLTEYGNRIAADSEAASVKTSKTDRRKSWARSISGRSLRKFSMHESSNVDQTVHPAHSGRPQSLSGPIIPPPRKSSIPAVPALRGTDSSTALVPDNLFDDGDDDPLTALPRPRRNEETLVDFLRSTGPLQERPLPNGTGIPSRSDTALPVLNTHGADAVTAAKRSANQDESTPSALPQTTRTVSDMLQDAAPGATAAAVAATASESVSAPLPAAVNRTKSTPQAPLSSGKASGVGSEGKRKWWAIFTPKKRDTSRRETKSGYLDM
jgi:hypothetical protein